MIMPPITLFGHAFGEDFSLPLPIWMFMFAAVAALVLSFLIASFLYDSKQEEAKLYTIAHKTELFSFLGKLLGTLLLLLTIATGFFGSQFASLNISVTFFWVIFLVGFTYVTAILGNVWKFINPFRTLIELAEKTSHKAFTPRISYPAKLGYFPALLIYIAIIWLELLFDRFGTTPGNISLMLSGYVVLSLVGAYIIGKDIWFRYVDFFSVYFRLIAKLSPLAYRQGSIILRWPFSGLMDNDKKSFSLLLFILFMLSSTSFDGFTETKQYDSLRSSLPGFIFESPLLYGTILLILSPLILFFVYVAFMVVAKIVTRTKLSVLDLSYKFAYTLIPIAIGYNIAHYFTYLLINGQNIVKLASDPFNVGMDIFGTADFEPNITFLSPYTQWYIQVGAIIIGHIAAVYIAHKVALGIFTNRRQAIISQLPVMGLMILYTLLSLWIIAQPVFIAQEQIQVQRQEEFQRLEGIREPPKPMPPQ